MAGKSTHDVNQLKLYQLGYHLELDEVETFEDNDEYLKATITLCNKILGDVNYFIHNPTPAVFKDKSNEYSDKLQELEKKKVKGENGEGQFKSTEFFEEYELSEEERTIVLLLLTKRGIGIKPKVKSLSGEKLINALKLLHDTSPEDSRQLLSADSKLMENNILDVQFSREASWKRRKRKEGKRRHSDIEGANFCLTPKAANAILGTGDLGVKEKNSSKRESRRREKRKEDLMESIDPEVSFSDVVVPHKLKDSILSLLSQENSKQKFFKEWNMKSVIGKREGINLLFSGPSGTGKTMMAKAIGNELEKKVYQVSMSDMVNCWYGETEKNVGRLFELMEEKEGVVLLDEADGLLTKRSNSNSSSGGTKNRMVNLILQKLEDHSGIIIMTSNLTKKIDPALERRMDLKVKFPMPDEEARKKIWKYHLPDELPLAEDVNIDKLARKYDFSGGKIRNAVVNAARYSLMDDGDCVSQEDLKTACMKEIEGEEAMDYSITEKKSNDSKRYA